MGEAATSLASVHQCASGLSEESQDPVALHSPSHFFLIKVDFRPPYLCLCILSSFPLDSQSGQVPGVMPDSVADSLEREVGIREEMRLGIIGPRWSS